MADEDGRTPTESAERPNDTSTAATASPTSGRPRHADASPGLSRRAVVGGALGFTAAVAAGTAVIQQVGRDSPAANGTPANGTRAAGGAAPNPAAERAKAAIAAPSIATPATNPRPPGPVLRQPRTILTLDQDLHMLRRATFGPTPELLAAVRKQGRRRWLDAQLRPASIDDSALDAVLGGYDLLGLSPAELKTRVDPNKNGWDPMFQLSQATLARQIWSRRQLFEVMVDFWNDVLHIPSPGDKVMWTRTGYDADVIRKHALGSFRNMLYASVTSPAMLQFLDNAYSTKDAPNENYGRELLELHTVGVAAGYRQRDVRAAALLLTGLSVDEETEAFAYKPENHHVGRLKIMGFSAANESASGGMKPVRGLVAYLAKHPATARRLATRLAQRFVADEPAKSLVDRLAKVYLANNTAIVPVLRTLFASPEFAVSVGQKYRRPLEQTVATARVLGVTPGDGGARKGIEGLYWQLDRAGNRPLSWVPPDGFPDAAASWLSSAGTLARWNTNRALIGGWYEELNFTKAPELWGGRPPKTYKQALDRLARRLLFQPVSKAHAAALLEFLDKKGTARVTDPNMEGRLEPLAALVLGAPYHQLR